MSELTAYQNKLITGLTKELERLNPKVNSSSVKERFSVDTIEQCLSEKQRFIDSVNSYNESIAKGLQETFIAEIESLRKEFKKYINIQVGWGRNDNSIAKGIDDFFKNIKMVDKYKEIDIFFVSKTRMGSDCAVTNGYLNYKIYCRFRFETDRITLKSGEQVNMNRIIGLKYCNLSYLHEDRSDFLMRNTLDDLIQDYKYLQQRIVDLSK